MNNFIIKQAICPKCGADNMDKYSLCRNCGEVLFTEKNPVTSVATLSGLNNAVVKNRLLSAMSYMGFFVIIPLCCSKNMSVNKFHINQGLSLFICEIVYFLSYMILSIILSNITTWLYCLMGVMLSVMAIFLIYSTIGIVSAFMNENRQLPIIGNMQIFK